MIRDEVVSSVAPRPQEPVVPAVYLSLLYSEARCRQMAAAAAQVVRHFQPDDFRKRAGVLFSGKLSSLYNAAYFC